MEFVVLQVGKTCFKLPVLDALSVGQALGDAAQVTKGYYPDTQYTAVNTIPESILIDLTAEFKSDPQEPSNDL